MSKYFIASILVSLTVGYFMNVYLAEYTYFPFQLVLYSLPGGVLAGYLGGLLDKKFAKLTLHKIGIMLLTIVLSFILSLQTLRLFIYFF